MSAQKLRLFSRLQLAAHHVKKTADRHIDDAINLTAAQAAVLSILANDKGHSQHEVAKILGINESAVTAMVNRLVRHGYIVRERSESDKRAWNLLLTDEGRAALLSARTAFDGINRIIEQELTKQEVEQFADYLERLSKVFDIKK
jgi:DNA-binding MarR family transcriptional regulator